MDRVVAHQSRMAMFSGSLYNVLPQIKSNHSPFLINITTPIIVARQEQKLFQYEIVWQLRKECYQVIDNAWSGA